MVDVFDTRISEVERGVTLQSAVRTQTTRSGYHRFFEYGFFLAVVIRIGIRKAYAYRGFDVWVILGYRKCKHQ